MTEGYFTYGQKRGRFFRIEPKSLVNTAVIDSFSSRKSLQKESVVFPGKRFAFSAFGKAKSSSGSL